MSKSLLALGSSPLKLGLLVLLATGASAFTPACSETDSTTAKCKTGDVLPCTCEGGKPSVRTCSLDTFTECRCDGLTARDAGQDASEIQSIADAALSDAALPDAEVVDRSCGTQASTSSVKESRPVDVIFVIDNSGSMSDEIVAIETNINDNFARILDERGVDYRVIMVATHGSSSSQHVCIKAPLSGTTCNPIPSQPVNGPRFFHYNRDVQSWDSLCRILDTFAAPLGTTAPQGWRAWLRPQALKVFVEVTDDNIECSTTYRRDGDAGTGTVNLSVAALDAAAGTPVDQGLALSSAFQKALFDLSPAQFGTAEKPNFVFHSVIGMAPNQPPTQPWFPNAPVQTELCMPGAQHAAPGYQVLSMITQGLRYPVCDGAGFDSMFLAIARNAVQSSNVECRFRIPEPPLGKYVDHKSITLEYNGAGGLKETLRQVEAADCDDHSFKVEEQDVVLCDSACTRVRKDKSAQLQVTYSCGEPSVLK